MARLHAHRVALRPTTLSRAALLRYAWLMALAVMGGFLGFALLVLVLAVLWGRRAWRRRDQYSPLAKVAAVLVFAAALAGALGTAAGLIMAFGAVGGESIEPSQKARMLAEGISTAMNCTSCSAIVWLASVVALFLVTRKPRK